MARDDLVMSFQSEFRSRLVHALDEAGIPSHARQAYVASLTSRAPQSVSRWLDAEHPGLPDLVSFVRLCAGLRRSSDALLNLESDIEAMEAGWARGIFQSMRAEFPGCGLIRMHGDEMAPAIREGDLMFVDRTVSRIMGNGIYALELGGRSLVRRVEAGLGPGLTLRCEQAGYRDQILENEDAAARLGLRVSGKVLGAVGLTRFTLQ